MMDDQHDQSKKNWKIINGSDTNGNIFLIGKKSIIIMVSNNGYDFYMFIWISHMYYR